MKVREIMCHEVASCRWSTNLAEAARTMWSNDCGAVPVVDDSNRVVGMITDRDICMAAATRGRRAAEITVGDVITGMLHSVSPDDDVREALEVMKDQQVRRLPVTGRNGELAGMLSLNDVILNVSVPRRRTANAAITPADVVETLRAIGQRQSVGIPG
ncbi:MAG TPA: CBS domain-containing protein [Terriglobales bacterium]|nr:CBS domain-containing protein [Terriglobales bacterium]